VVVVGASTAGLAYLLAPQGHRVCLFDQGRTLGPPQRTLIVTDQINHILGFTPRLAVLNHIHEIELLSPNRRAVIPLRAPDLVLERERLVQLLAERARQAGVRIELGHSFLEPTENTGGLALYDQGIGGIREVKAEVLIGADGVGSRVARAVGYDHHERVTVLQARVTLPPGTGGHTVRVWFQREWTPYFYWLIPESAHTGVLGLACEDHERAEEALGEFLEAHGWEPLGLQAADVALYHPRWASPRRLNGTEVFLIGDAGGQVKVTTMGGVVAGLRGARAVVEALSPCPNGRPRRRRTGKAFGALSRELALHRLLRVLLNRFGDSDYDRLLEALSDRTRHVLQSYTRDELRRAFLRLLLAQPRLLPLAARPLMRLRR